MEAMANMFLGKEVKIFPGDTIEKHGIVRDINQIGVVFEITKIQVGSCMPGPGYKVGDLVFIGASKLTFALIS